MDEDLLCLRRIRRVSRIIVAICTGVIVLVPLALALTWTNFNIAVPNFEFLSRIPYQGANLTWVNQLAGFAVTLSLAGVLIYGVHRRRRLFALYSMGHVFTEENVRCLRWFALSIMIYAGLLPVAGLLLSVILTLGNAPEERALILTLSSTEIVLVFLGSVLLIVSRVMRESARLAEEHAQII